MGNDSCKTSWPYHWKDSYDRGQCGTFEVVYYPSPSACMETDYTQTPQCKFNGNMLYYQLIGPLLAVAVMISLGYYFWGGGRYRAEQANRQLFWYIVIVVWTWCPVWLCAAAFHRNISREWNTLNDGWLYAVILTLILAAVTIVAMCIFAFCEACKPSQPATTQPRVLAKHEAAVTLGTVHVAQTNGNGYGSPTQTSTKDAPVPIVVAVPSNSVAINMPPPTYQGSTTTGGEGQITIH